MNEPKTWSDVEIIDIIERELIAYKQDCMERQRKFTNREAAECILLELETLGLINDTP